MQFAYFKKVLAKDKKKRRHDSDSEEEADEDDIEQAGEDEAEVSKPPESKKQKNTDTPATDTTTATAGEISSDKLEQFKTALYGVFEHQQSLPMDDIRKHIVGQQGFTEGEMMAAIEKMSDDNKLMLSANVLYLI